MKAGPHSYIPTITLLLFFMMSHFMASGQKETSKWFLQNNNRLTFNGNNITASLDYPSFTGASRTLQQPDKYWLEATGDQPYRQ